MRKVRDFQRLAEKENEQQNGGASGYRGPDGSGQWVSMGELGDNDLDSVLGSVGGGKITFALPTEKMLVFHIRVTLHTGMITVEQQEGALAHTKHESPHHCSTE